MSLQPSDELFARIAERLKALADPTRLKILHTVEDRELCVTEILAEVGGSQANVSKHLSKMRTSGVLASRREGTNIFYRVVDPAAFTICRTVCDALEQRAESEHRLLKSAAVAARKAFR
ncbi:MAG: metalloregulator ArsR/SmtB family transcription factor [Thermoanaerobaculia bacterium]